MSDPEHHGRVLINRGGEAVRYQFSSKEYDATVGLNYYGYRYYSPELGRWLNRDPIGERGGINLYAFLRNAPNLFVDPLGLASWIDYLLNLSDWNALSDKVSKHVVDTPFSCSDVGMWTIKSSECNDKASKLQDALAKLLDHMTKVSDYRDDFGTKYFNIGINAALAASICGHACPSPPDSIADPLLAALVYGPGLDDATQGYMFSFLSGSSLVASANSLFPHHIGMVDTYMNSLTMKSQEYISKCCCD